jgi:hypothetical protein
MALFKDFFSSSRAPKDAPSDSLLDSPARARGPETAPVKMNLEERMAFRREILFETIRASLNARLIAPHTYRFRVMRTDRRGHCFAVMLDMSPTFMSSPAGQQSELAATAALLTKNADGKYGLTVTGVYWRVDETLDTAVARWAQPSMPAPLEQPGTTAEQRRLINKLSNTQSNIEKYEDLSAEDLAEFESSWKKDSAVLIGNRTYASDLAPLAEELAEK